jgi:hypothetical protein
MFCFLLFLFSFNPVNGSIYTPLHFTRSGAYSFFFPALYVTGLALFQAQHGLPIRLEAFSKVVLDISGGHRFIYMDTGYTVKSKVIFNLHFLSSGFLCFALENGKYAVFSLTNIFAIQTK